jgi:hypothetical protein
VRWSIDPSTPRNKPGFKKNDKNEPAETTAKFKRPAGNKAGAFRVDGTGETFRLSTSSTMTSALVVPGPDGNPVRFRAEMLAPDAKGKLVPLTDELAKGDPKGVVYAPNMRFVEEKGSRYIQAKQLDEHKGVMFVPSSGVVATALLLNIGHFVVWFLAIWLLLRFSWGHALGFSIVAGLVTMLVILPLLFKPNRVPRAAEPIANSRSIIGAVAPAAPAS